MSEIVTIEVPYECPNPKCALKEHKGNTDTMSAAFNVATNVIEEVAFTECWYCDATLKIEGYDD